MTPFAIKGLAVELFTEHVTEYREGESCLIFSSCPLLWTIFIRIPFRPSTVHSAVLYRDHRWILPVIRHAGDVGLLEPPSLVVTFDRHRDALAPEDKAKVLGGLRASSFTFEELINCVKYHLSPRDDDWIVAGMELGLVSNVIQFGCIMDEDAAGTVMTEYIDGTDLSHKIFHLDTPSRELSYKGALTDRNHKAAVAGLWELFVMEPVHDVIRSGNAGIFL